MNRCGQCDTESKNLKRCPKCGKGICPYCYEDGHDGQDGEPCSGEVGEEDE